MTLTRINTNSITDGSIIDADINASAAIAGTKVSPDFGSQNIVTTGGLTVDTNTLVVDAPNNRVGIGTSSPSEKLSINEGNIKLTSTDTFHYISLSNTSTGGRQWTLANAGASDPTGVTAGNLYLRDSTAGANRIAIDSSGRVGIGTTSPSSLLHLSSNLPVLTFTDVNDASSSNVYQDDNLFVIDVDSANAKASSALAFKVDNTERARIDSSGRLLVGTSSSSASAAAVLQGFAGSPTGQGILQLQVGKNTAATAINENLGSLRFANSDGNIGALISGEADLQWNSGDYPSRLVFSVTSDGASSPTERARINNAGEFSFRNTSYVYPATDNAVSLGLSGFRFSAVWAANGTIQTSDKRAKADIASATLGSDFIKALRPVSYKWIDGGKCDTGERDEDNNYIYESIPGERTHWGFIAQEVKQAVDDAGVDFGGWVLTDKDDPDSQQALRYDQFIAPLTKALQETMAELEALKAEVAALKAQ